MLFNVDVTVNTNIVSEDKGNDGNKQLTLYYSLKGNAVVSITPSGKAAVYIFSTTSKNGRIAAFTKSRVEAKVCASCAEALRNELSGNFEQFMAGN